MIEAIDRLEQANNQKANRTLSLIYADRDRRLDRALDLAQAELKVRGDVYTYDALAWALYKNKRYEESAKAMEKALRMGTPEPSFHIHAGLIAAALGANADARKHLERAVALNAKLDPRSAALVESALKETRQ